jgi:hypothetical protein
LGIPGTTTIYGYENSTAQAYAEEYGFAFEALAAVNRGDINRDNSVDLKDVTLLFQYVNGQVSALGDRSVADVNGDSKVDLKDVTLLFQFVNGQIDAL